MRVPAAALAAVLATAFLATPAFASGGIGCDAEDGNLAFLVNIGMTRGSGGFFNVEGTLDIARNGMPDDLRSLPLGAMLIHSWIDGEALKLQFYHERTEGDFASVNLVIEAEATEEGDYPGTYHLTVYGAPLSDDPEAEPWRAEGKVSCMVE